MEEEPGSFWKMPLKAGTWTLCLRERGIHFRRVVCLMWRYWKIIDLKFRSCSTGNADCNPPFRWLGTDASAPILRNSIWRDQVSLGTAYNSLFVCDEILTVSLDNYWNKAENRRKFFLEFASANNFDPLIPANWYSVTHSKLHQFSQVCFHTVWL